MLKFGDKIEFDVRFKRIKRDVTNKKTGWVDDCRIWELTPVPLALGIVIGRRTLWNGTAECEEGWNYFAFGNSVPAYLVAVDMATNPVYVPLDQFNEEERIKHNLHNATGTKISTLSN